MSERRARMLPPVLAAALVLGGLSVAQDTFFRENVERELTAASTRALAKSGLTTVEVTFAGRDATVRASGADGTAALRVVENVEGVRAAKLVTASASGDRFSGGQPSGTAPPRADTGRDEEAAGSPERPGGDPDDHLRHRQRQAHRGGPRSRETGG